MVALRSSRVLDSAHQLDEPVVHEEASVPLAGFSGLEVPPFAFEQQAFEPPHDVPVHADEFVARVSRAEVPSLAKQHRVE